MKDPPCSPVCIKTLQAVSPCFRKKFKKRNQFYWFVKGLPICWLEKGGEKANKTNLLLITLMEAQLLPSPDILEVLIFFFFVCKILSYFNGVKRSTFKKTHWKLSAGNKMGAVVFARLGDKHVDTTVWLKQACSNFLTPLRILITYQVREHNSEVFSWENFIFYIWSVSWNTGCAVFFLYPGD